MKHDSGPGYFIGDADECKLGRNVAVFVALYEANKKNSLFFQFEYLRLSRAKASVMQSAIIIATHT